MVSNPMQRKSRTSLILGIFIGLLIMGLVVAVLYLQLNETKKELEAVKAVKKSVYVLNEDVLSGEIVTTDMFSRIEVDGTAIPSGATSNIESIESYFLKDRDGNDIITVSENGVRNKYVEKNGVRYLINEDTENPGNYYITVNNQREEIKFETAPLVAKINLNKNTVVTANMFNTSDEKTTDDLRMQEYNMIKLSSELATGDFVDIRLRLPSGLDYIVISKKKVEIPEIAGIPSEGTIRLNMTEAETLIMSEAIVEAYMIDGSVLYTTNYIEPGLQGMATPTFVANEATINLITQNPNVVSEAATAIYNRYRDDATGTRSKFTAEINKDTDKAESNVVSKSQSEVTAAQTIRKSYLDSLSE